MTGRDLARVLFEELGKIDDWGLIDPEWLAEIATGKPAVTSPLPPEFTAALERAAARLEVER